MKVNIKTTNLIVNDHLNICLSTRILIPTNICQRSSEYLFIHQNVDTNEHQRNYSKTKWTNPVLKSCSFQYSHLIPDGLICFCGGGSSAGTYPVLKENWLNILNLTWIACNQSKRNLIRTSLCVWNRQQFGLYIW